MASLFEKEAIIINADDPHLDLSKTTTDGRDRVSSTLSTVSASIPFWGNDPASWDTVRIGSYTLPGVARLSGAIKRRVDRKKSTGKHGSTVTYLGDEAAEFTITVTMWTSIHLESFYQIVNWLKSLKPERAAGLSSSQKISAKVVPVYHPALSVFSVTLAHVLEYGLPEPDGDDGKFRASLKCLQYIPPSVASGGGVSTPTGPTTGDLDSVQRSRIITPKPSTSNTQTPAVTAQK